MSGLNSIVGLNKVSVDYRPEIVSTEKNEGKKDVDNIAKDVDNTVKNVDNIESGVDNVQNGDYMDTLFMEFPKKDKDKKGGENA